MGNVTATYRSAPRRKTCLPNRLLIVGAVALLVSLSPARHAHATIVTGSFTGVMDGGVDTYGYFGSAGYNVTGQTITGTFAYDTASVLAQSPPCSVAGEGCFSGAGITITESIAGTGSYTFSGTSPLLPGGLVLYANFPSATLGADGFTLFSSDGSVGGDTSTLRNTTLEIHSTTDNFITDPLNPAPEFSMTEADANVLSYGTINFSFTGASESLGFHFNSPSSSVQASSDIPEPSALLCFGAGALLLRGKRRPRGAAPTR